MTEKLMSRSICFEPISKSALYQGTTSVVPKRASGTRAFSPCGAISLSVPLRQLNLRGGHYLCSIQ
jgi:hypothetical protein